MKTEKNKVFYTWRDVESMTLDLVRSIDRSDWRPDYVVGLTRGGLHAANLISQWYHIPMETLKVNLRDHAETGPESNLWMAEDGLQHGKKILIVDDINDSGATINWIKDDWNSSVFNGNVDAWGNNIRIATLVDNSASDADVDYACVGINKLDDPDLWITFPWESWWLNHE
jgi:hypoxanthine phosphoribosyltransferase